MNAFARTPLVETATALVEDLRSSGAASCRHELYSPRDQVCLPYHGMFVWHVGGDAVVADPNQVIFVAEDEAFHLSQPRAETYAELIITPGAAVLAELTEADRPSRHPLFRRRSRRADATLQAELAAFLHAARHGGADTLAREETVVRLLRLALQRDDIADAHSPATRRLTNRAKEFLHAHLAEPIRLEDVSRAVGASPAYLTSLFRRVEGVPLHRYLVQLRLAHALVELPHADDLTTLALNTGFSSHSHFTLAFRRHFGEAPSAFRRRLRSSRMNARGGEDSDSASGTRPLESRP